MERLADPSNPVIMPNISKCGDGRVTRRRSSISSAAEVVDLWEPLESIWRWSGTATILDSRRPPSHFRLHMAPRDFFSSYERRGRFIRQRRLERRYNVCPSLRQNHKEVGACSSRSGCNMDTLSNVPRVRHSTLADRRTPKRVAQAFSTSGCERSGSCDACAPRGKRVHVVQLSPIDLRVSFIFLGEGLDTSRPPKQ